MKKISRMLIFSAASLFLLTRLDSGVLLSSEWEKILMAIILIAIIYYIVHPVIKILLLPINIITLGLTSFISYIIIFIIVNNYFDLIKFRDWEFPGIYFNSIIIRSFTLSPLANKVFSAFFISLVISFLETII